MKGALPCDPGPCGGPSSSGSLCLLLLKYKLSVVVRSVCSSSFLSTIFIQYFVARTIRVLLRILITDKKRDLAYPTMLVLKIPIPTANKPHVAAAAVDHEELTQNNVP